MNRKDFIKHTSMAAAAIHLPIQPSLASETSINTLPTLDKINIALIGVGLRGQNHLALLLKRTDVDVVAICDIDERMLTSAKAMITKAGKKMPQIYSNGNQAWRKLLEQKNIHAVIISTPWEWHTSMIIGSLQAGIKYVGTEVVLGITLQDHWDVVNATQRANAHVCMLENVCYRRDVMAILNMVRKGLFGEIVHLQGGYQHDLRAVKFNDGKQAYGGGCEMNEKGWTEAKWRTKHSIHRNGDLYPTHGIGPLAHYININRGNRFINLCSFASKGLGLHQYIVNTCGENHPNAKVQFKLGDVVTTSITCANGETILLQHDTNLPRPYSLGFRVQGTNGIWMDINKGVHIEGTTKAHQWDDAKQWYDKYDHPLWARWTKDAQGAGHGGMDFFVIHMFVESVKNGTAPQMDVYDAATWSAITPLSEKSIALGNETVEFPDFTSGQWMYRQPVFALSDNY